MLYLRIERWRIDLGLVVVNLRFYKILLDCMRLRLIKVA